ncbi:hypothetical protein Q5P01_013031 [Channa striata]|uniref:Programmed cell death protein 2 C-terminal domain-containing protein n=1 Tax=Channa striata TaxID=64152 RepID=A0AA88MPY6_CHASR|nr:hypothetical protein Q5P01_013031 [Channa striata]
MASPTHEFSLIGLCDGHLDPGRYQSSYLTNKVGGHPDWLPGISRPSPRCARCGLPLAHVVQVYCPLQASPYHRNLHLFACPGAACSGRPESWKVLRSQCPETEAPTAGKCAPAQGAPLSATDWCDTADDWGVEDGDDEWGGGVKQDGRVQEEAEDSPVPDLVGENDDLEHARELLRAYESRERVVVGQLDGDEGGGGEEKYEKTKARHGDVIFSKFMKKISLCPQQILRYCRGGTPLFISESPSNMAQVVSACSSCGGSRTFELQLMPALVSLLQRVSGSAEVELEFGTVLVYTCTNSCWTAGSGSAVEELCLVQTDPDQQFFK